ncbi:MAG TPA: 3-oxoacyl-[acyl-carrier-protein] reductase [Tepidanaerobacter syntrophicus]|uniref:3-oxoacyl-[acyl-carrier-protein] reductase n=1 Tax=Tepidanaerobacter syntrophicus TaxID=224999 RepID=UPI00174F95F8|nr:3-oxoacyl-[acyl-carrier-protein] reductase [Tepidanaerobacter syntrophicus]HHV84176.1 3-oxoacyl-[acyl-carrier-protein] reductase [Tepidanaerobacter syntrophicus]
MNLSSKVCLVTGGSKGIGRSICIEFAKNGADIALNYSSDEKAAVQTAEEIRKLGAKVETFKTDVSDFQQVEKMVKDIYDKFGRIDILVNNAGITKDALLLRMTEKEWDKVIDVNLKGVFNTSKACVRYMLKQKQGGRIINISSIVGIYGNAGQTNYAAAKAGIIGFTKSLAKELGSRDITVNAIAPGFIRTDMTLSLLQKDSDISKNIPLKRLGNPEDVAKTAAFLASEDASYITGQVIAVDGGLIL